MRTFISVGGDIELGRLRSKFIRQAALWVCELADRDRVEAEHAADELRRYFRSVLESLPEEEREPLAEQVDAVCDRFGECARLLRH